MESTPLIKFKNVLTDHPKLIAILLFGSMLLSPLWSPLLDISKINPNYVHFTIITALITLLIHHVAKLVRPIPSLEIVCPDETFQDSVKEYIKKKKPSKFTAIQYSGNEIREVVRALISANKECAITLLLYDPREISKESKQAIRMRDSHTEYDRLEDEKNVKITRHYYRTPPSIRGMNIGEEWFSVGWYVQYPDKRRDTSVEIMGHNKPQINILNTTKEGKMIEKMYTEQYNKLFEKSIESSELEEFWKGSTNP